MQKGTNRPAPAQWPFPTFWFLQHLHSSHALQRKPGVTPASLALLLPACLHTATPFPRALRSRLRGAPGACLAQRQSKQEVLEFMSPGAAPNQWHSGIGRQTPWLPHLSGDGTEVKLTPGGTEPRSPRPDLLIRAPGTSCVPAPTPRPGATWDPSHISSLPLSLCLCTGGSQAKPCLSPNQTRSLAHTFILSGNFANSMVPFDHPLWDSAKPVPVTFAVEKFEIGG